jgi:hypothetical protein
MSKLDPEFKAKWCAALRSGKYKQGERFLRPTEDTYCCLGVAAVLLGVDLAPARLYESDGYDAVKAAGVENLCELFHRNDGMGSHRRHSFSEIADYIEANL